MPGTNLYRVSYRIGGEGRGSYEVTRLVRTSNADVDAVVQELGRRWSGQPLRRIEIVEPVEDL